jgi:hypothetical protein
LLGAPVGPVYALGKRALAGAGVDIAGGKPDPTRANDLMAQALELAGDDGVAEAGRIAAIMLGSAPKEERQKMLDSIERALLARGPRQGMTMTAFIAYARTLPPQEERELRLSERQWRKQIRQVQDEAKQRLAASTKGTL